ncbi:MAG: hypothetical protein INR68_11300 [Methylobacterium mesophilicum]|nr:hypothetical protein [Methylobacterium mesophilicum]
MIRWLRSRLLQRAKDKVEAIYQRAVAANAAGDFTEAIIPRQTANRMALEARWLKSKDVWRIMQMDRTRRCWLQMEAHLAELLGRAV